jgi:hypothetical protein
VLSLYLECARDHFPKYEHDEQPILPPSEHVPDPLAPLNVEPNANPLAFVVEHVPDPLALLNVEPKVNPLAVVVERDIKGKTAADLKKLSRLKKTSFDDMTLLSFLESLRLLT